MLASGSDPVPDTDCRMHCTGSSTEACGGSNRLNLYSSGQPTPVINPGTGLWVSLGCYVDEPARTLTGLSSAIDNNTVDSCTSACQQAGFQYAGVEVSSGCSCS
jgi:hypothetical protein